ncbi:DUF488 domain-containing protein [Acidihalobacter aeolianus]|nr:DUF488 domain-containing protein [Acidihalobacter aeolianus]
MDVRCKRIYDPPDGNDGQRVLVDRLWPRGIARNRAALDLWLREIAPSDALRRWFAHSPDRYAEFAARYRDELTSLPEETALLRRMAAEGRLTLLYAARDTEHNNAHVLADWLNGL